MPQTPRVTALHHDEPAHGFVLVLAGGGYARRADHEDRPVVDWLTRHGVAAGHLDYAVAPATHPTALVEVLDALAEIRSGVHGPVTGPVLVLGFSAGAHLAGLALTATEDDLDHAAHVTGRDRSDLSRPDAAVLCYPVVSMTHLPHHGSRTNLLGRLADDEAAAARLSVEHRVDTATGPVFAWHTADDAVVAVEHPLRLSSALARAHVPHELHVYPSGEHGLGLATGSGAPSGWTTACLRWLDEIGLTTSPGRTDG